MIYYKTQEEIELIRQSCLLVCKTLAEVATHIKPGVSGIELDKLAESFILSHDAKPGFKGYRGFPATLCFSVNEVVVHGIPSKDEVKEGDIVSVDCGVYMNGFFGDAAYTFLLDGTTDDVVQLCKVTKEALYKGIEQAKSGNRIGDIGSAIQEYCSVVNPYGVVRELVGHGLGKNLHEAPDVPNFGKRGKGLQMKEGLVLAIEPMINLGLRNVVQLNDGWTIITRDKKPSAHYEHSIAVGKDGADILSDHTLIENSIKKNQNLIDISIIN
jgi:methionyl aminopeptidase